MNGKESLKFWFIMSSITRRYIARYVPLLIIVKKLVFFTGFLLLTSNILAQKDSTLFTKVPKTGLEASIDSIGYKIDVAFGKAEDEAEKQLYKHVSSRFTDEFMFQGGSTPDNSVIGVGYKLNFPFWEWKHGEANTALFIGMNYGGKNPDDWFSPNENGYNLNTNFLLMAGHVMYPFTKKRLFLETSVYAGLNTARTKEIMNTNESVKDKRHMFSAGVYGKFGYYLTRRFGLFANAMIPICPADNDSITSPDKRIFRNNTETPMLFGLGVIIKPMKI